MKTMHEFRYGLHFRNIAGGSNSFEDLTALRDLLKSEAWETASIMGKAVVLANMMGDHELSIALRNKGDALVTMYEEDVQAIDRYLEQRGIEQ